MEQTYTAIETLGGFLAFTDTAEGRRKLRQFLQQTADAYFNPAFNSGALSVYRAEGELGNRPWVNPGRMRPDEYPYGPKPHGDRMELLYRGEMRPTAEDFRSFCHNAGCEISARNVNITDTLDALERYDRRVEELQRIPAKSARDREELLQTLETRRQLQKLMDSAYDVRGYRTAGRILDDPAECVILEGVPLYGPHRSVLKEGLGLYLPRESGNNPSHAYAWVDQATDRIIFGGNPPVDRKTVRIRPEVEKRLYSPPGKTRKRTGTRPKM